MKIILFLTLILSVLTANAVIDYIESNEARGKFKAYDK